MLPLKPLSSKNPGSRETLDSSSNSKPTTPSSTQLIRKKSILKKSDSVGRNLADLETPLMSDQPDGPEGPDGILAQSSSSSSPRRASHNLNSVNLLKTSSILSTTVGDRRKLLRNFSTSSSLDHDEANSAKNGNGSCRFKDIQTSTTGLATMSDSDVAQQSGYQLIQQSKTKFERGRRVQTQGSHSKEQTEAGK